MPSNKETLFQEHICAFLEQVHGFRRLRADEPGDVEHHVIEADLIGFTIEAALKGIQEKFTISDAEALVIREICTEVNNNYEIKERIIANRENEDYLT